MSAIVFYYIIHGSRCFFLEPAPQLTQDQPMHAQVELCQQPTTRQRSPAGIGDTVAINGTDTTVWGVIIDFQE